MYCRYSHLDSYEMISECLMNGRNKNDRPIPYDYGGSNNTRLVRLNDNEVGIKLYKTIIVIYYKNGNIQLNTDGWQTVTTRDRMNGFQSKFSVWQEKYIWYLSYHDKTYLYEDQMLLHPEGSITDSNQKLIKPYSKEEQKKMNKLKRSIDTYCKNFITKFFNHEIPQPDRGDCWDCSFHNVEKPTESMGDMAKSNHILNHIKEKYYVPSLLNNAIQEVKSIGISGLAPIDEHNIAYGWKANGWESNGPMMQDITHRRLVKVLKQYIHKRTGLGMS